MSFVATAIIGAGALGAGASIYSANKAASAQEQAIGQASQTIQQGQQASLGAIDKYLAPYINFSKGLQPTLQSLLTPGPSQTQTLSQLPGFQFAKSIAGDLVSAGAGQTGISGTTAVQGGELGAQLASQYFSNFTNPLINLYNTGAVSAGQGAQGAANVFTGGAQSLAGLAVGQGNVQAGQYGAIGGAIGGLGNSIANAALIAKLTGGGGGAWGGGQKTFYPNPNIPGGYAPGYA